MPHEALSAADLFRTCANRRDSDAWVEFHKRYHRTIAGVVAKTTLAKAHQRLNELEDLVQEVYQRLCRGDGKALRDFVSTGANSEFGYLKVIARNTTLSGLKMEPENIPVPDDGDVSDKLSGQKKMERSVLIRELAAHLKETETDRDCEIFWLYYRAGLTAEQIASFRKFGLTTKGVESVIGRQREKLRDKFGRKDEGKTRSVGFF